jgi:hypothetical protein
VGNANSASNWNAEWNGSRSRQTIIFKSMNPIESSPIVSYLLTPPEHTDTNIECPRDCEYHPRIAP